MGSVNLIRGSWVDTTDLSATTRYYPLPDSSAPGAILEQTTECKFSFDCSGGVTLTVEWCGHTGSASTVPATADWVDVTLKCVPITGAAAASFVDAKNTLLVTLPPGRVRVKCVTADATNAVQIFATLQPCDGTGNGAGAIMAPPLPLDAATQTTLAAELLLTGAARTTTAPNVTDATPRRIEIARDGSARVNSDIRDHIHQTHLVVAGAFVRTPLTFPCDGIRTDVESAVVYGQPAGRPYHVTDGLTFAVAGNWGGAHWAVAGNKATHTAGGGFTDALTSTTSVDRPIVIGKRYCTVIKVSGRTAGQVQVALGTTLGTARVLDGTYVEVLACAANTTITVVPDATFDGSVEILQVYPRTPKLAANCYEAFSFSEIVGIAAGGAMSTLLAASDTVEVHALYHRVPGVADLG
jgi:hypothetical protein